MLEIIENLPSHVLGVRAKGTVNTNDFNQTIKPHLEEYVDKFGELNYLLVLDTSLKNFSYGVLLQNIKTGSKHFKKVNKVAVVTDQKVVEFFSDVATIAVKGSARGFSKDKEAEARTWISND